MTSLLIRETIEDMRLSWSSISSFDKKWGYGSPEKWYRKYILKESERESPEMLFGKQVADSFQTDKPLAPVTLYPVVEKKLEVVFHGIPLVGYLDTYDPKTHSFREFKTGKRSWTRQRAQKHGQLYMYALMLYIAYKIKPENYTIHLDWIPTQDSGDFSLSFVQPVKVYTHEVKLTMNDILKFSQYVKMIHSEMEAYVKAQAELSTPSLALSSSQV